jgi:RNA-directed DNA polymerase
MAKRKAPDESQSEAWNELPWRKLERYVYRIQKRIYRAKQAGKTRAVQKLQKLVMKSEAARLLAVRRVTQDNQGKKTAGIDGVKSVKPRDRLTMVEMIHPRYRKRYKPEPARRVWIPKPGKEEKRPLGIPVMLDRAIQALTKMAIEPEWEAIFEPNSYGFRPGRSVHDAMAQIHRLTCRKEKYILDADIKGCFDNIDHKRLLAKINTTSGIKHLIRGWLKAGVMNEDGRYETTNAGTPQGGVISPLLANIALHGMERDLIKTYSYKEGKPQMVRYADDFVVFHETEGGIVKARRVIEAWVQEIGLELKPSKTRVSHTLKRYQGNVGFDFLGFTVRQFSVGKYKSSKDRWGNVQGFKVIIRPSKEAVKKHLAKTKEITRKNRTKAQKVLIVELNSVIRGWANYYKTQASKATFNKSDYYLWWQLMRWAKYRQSGGTPTQMEKKYWKDGKFAVDERYKLRMHSETAITRHIQVGEGRSPYDGDIAYWSTRLRNHPMLKSEKGILLKRCKGKCKYCELHFRDGDILEVDHHMPLYLGGKDTLDNKVILHRHCHDQRHAEFEKSRRKQVEFDEVCQKSEQATQMNGIYDKN